MEELLMVCQIEEEQLRDQVNYYQDQMERENQINNLEEYEFINLLQVFSNITNTKRKKLNDIQNIFDQLQKEEQEEEIQEIDNRFDLVTKIEEEDDKAKYLQDQMYQMSKELQQLRSYNNDMVEQINLIDQTKGSINKQKDQDKFNVHMSSKILKKYRSYLHEQVENQILRKQSLNEKIDNQRQDIQYINSFFIIISYGIQLCEDNQNKIQEYQRLLVQQANDIEDLDKQMVLKYSQIEKCSDFLEELDDFDKLALIFIYESPTQFQLDNIAKVLEQQLNQPARILQRSSVQEFVQRLRFNQVSIRINLFYKFHRNNLNETINQLIQVFRTLLINEETYSNRYNDLLSQKNNHKALLSKLSDQLKFYQKQDYDQTMIVISFNQIEDSKTQNLQLLRQLQELETYLITSYAFVQQTLTRLLNTLVSVKEVLKQCNPSDFDENFYMKWTYNDLFKNIKIWQDSLDSNHSIKITAYSKSMRHSNLIINQIYDQLEEKLVSKQSTQQNSMDTLRKVKLSNMTKVCFDNYTEDQIYQILQQIEKDPFLNTFCNNSLIQQLYIHIQGIIRQKIEEDENLDIFNLIIEEICITGRHIGLTIMKKKQLYLMDTTQNMIIETRKAQKNDDNVSKIISKKFNIKEILKKHSQNELSMYKQSDWKKSIVRDKINQLEEYKGLRRLQSLSTASENQLQIKNLEKKNDEVPNFMLQKRSSLPQLRKELYQSLKGYKYKSSDFVSTEQVPIFNYLNSHHQSNKIKINEKKLKLKNMMTNIRIEEVNSARNTNRMKTKRSENFNSDEKMISKKNYSKSRWKCRSQENLISHKKKYYVKLNKQSDKDSDFIPSKFTTNTITPIKKQSISTASNNTMKQIYGKEAMNKTLKQFKTIPQQQLNNQISNVHYRESSKRLLNSVAQSYQD